MIDGDRTARQTSGRRSEDARRFTVSSKQLRALKRELKAARFASLKRRYAPRYVVNDDITETVTYKAARSPSPPAPTHPPAWTACSGASAG